VRLAPVSFDVIRTVAVVLLLLGSPTRVTPMLFEPCGTLLKDYAAYCETMGVTEREDVYRSIHLYEEPPLEVGTDGGVAGDLTSTPRFGSAHGRNDRSSAGAGHPANLSGTAAATPEKDGQQKRKTSKESGKEKGKRISMKAGGKGEDRGREAADATASSRDMSPILGPVRLTSVVLRYPTFCMNQRDITPLCRAMPYCPSLVSIALVGCGLSVESYVLLVEAVYTSSRILYATIDFNCSAAARREQQMDGFLPDPTVPARSSSTTTPADIPLAVVHIEESGKTAAAVEETRSTSPTQEGWKGSSSRKASSTRPGSMGSNGANSKRQSKQLSRMPEISVEQIAPLEDEPGAVYLYPTQYCGLDQIPTPLELALQEEREKKGKIDVKRQQHLAAQQEQLRAFNLVNRVKVPRSWEAILYTGVRSLSLRGNNIGDAVVVEMASVMMENMRSQLVTLNLWGNNITDIGASAIATMLRGNTTLRSLDLGGNQIGDAGLLELANVFRMREMSPGEELQKYRRKCLTHASASEVEQRAALHPLAVGEVPSYDDLYAAWYAEQVHTEVAAPLGTPPLHLPPPPPSSGRDSGGAGGLLGAGAASKRTTPSKGKSAKAEVSNLSNTANTSIAATSMRPTVPFDRACIRLSHTADSLIRVPGNRVLQVLNMGDNEKVTLAGAREAVRRLGLHEPSTREEMSAMVDVRGTFPVAPPTVAVDTQSKRPSGGNSRGTSSSTLPAAQGVGPISVIQPPELHCAEVPLLFYNVVNKRQTNREAWGAMDEVQQIMQRQLESWATVQNGKAFDSGVFSSIAKPLDASRSTPSRAG